MIKWLLKLRIRLTMLLVGGGNGYAGRLLDITPWHDVLVLRFEYGMYVVSDRKNYLADWEIGCINNNRYEN